MDATWRRSKSGQSFDDNEYTGPHPKTHVAGTDEHHVVY